MPANMNVGSDATNPKPSDIDNGVVCARQRWETAALGDGNMRNLRKGDIIQLERKGYFIIDRPLISTSKPLVRPSSGRVIAREPLSLMHCTRANSQTLACGSVSGTLRQQQSAVVVGQSGSYIAHTSTPAQVLLSIPDGRAVKSQPQAAGPTANGKK